VGPEAKARRNRQSFLGGQHFQKNQWRLGGKGGGKTRGGGFERFLLVALGKEKRYKIKEWGAGK